MVLFDKGRCPYKQIPLVPTIVAESVCAGHGMSIESVREFADKCEERCRLAYESGCGWMVKLAEAPGFEGVSGLRTVLAHWRDSYCKNRSVFMSRWSAFRKG
jgi:hypothetical protein